jgi:hypothetical protein
MRFRLLLCFALLVPSSADAQRPRRCSGSIPDSATFLAEPVYRDCEVDRAARRRGGEPRLSMTSVATAGLREGCYFAELEFIIDTTGAIETASVKVTRSEMRELLEATRESMNQLRFEPAMKDGKPVRQVGVYRRTIAIAAPRGGAAFSSAPTPRCY